MRGIGHARRRVGAGERGTIAPAFLGFVWVTVIMGVIFFQLGRATDLSAEAQTGTDAAALAAAEDIHNQILEWIFSGEWYYSPFIVDVPRATAQATSYAQRNDVVITDFAIRTVGYLSYDVAVEAETQRRLTPAGDIRTDPETGEERAVTFGDGETFAQDATARVAPGTGSFLSGGFFTTGGGGAGASGPGSGGGGGGSATTTSGGCPISAGELATLATAAGVTPEFAQTSALGRYSDCDGGVSVRSLTEPMKISLLRLEQAMAVPLQLNSAYRSPAYQADLCQRVAGPCAAPGASMHNVGLAVDVGNWQAAAAAVSGDPSIGLCQPLPSNDAVHFSHVSGRECGGRTGASNGGAPGGQGSPPAYGGYASLVSQALIEVGLVE